MNWYCGHIIMNLELRDRSRQREYLAYENLVLFAADSASEAFAKAEAYGRCEGELDDETLTWGGEPARWAFAGVRMVVECQDPLDGNPSGQPREGTEVSYIQLSLKSREDVEKLAAGESLEVFYDEMTDGPDGRSEGRDRDASAAGDNVPDGP